MKLFDKDIYLIGILDKPLYGQTREIVGKTETTSNKLLFES
jgi:hypothetical protein